MIGCIIQARLGSTRLPGKVMRKINDETPMLKFQLEQLQSSNLIDKKIIATTILPADDLIANFCKENGIEYFRGESNDVLDRYYNCAKKFQFSTIVRITSDNPLIDPFIVDNVIDKFMNSKYDYASTDLKTYPLGFAVEIFTFEALEKSWKETTLPSEREHVTPYFFKNKEIFRQNNFPYKENYSHIRCTVDTEFDFKLIQEIILKINSRPIHLNDVLKLYKKEPEIFQINKNVKHDGYERSLKEDKEFLEKKEN